jgi:cytochrome b561
MITEQQPRSQTTASEPLVTIGKAGKLAYAVMLAGLIALTFSGIGTFTFGHPPMTHWVLMAHVGIAPLFALGLAGVALTWADCCRFGDARSPFCAVTKILFWLLLVCGLVVILSGVVPMTPVFGSVGQHTLYLTHRVSGIAQAILVVLHALSLRSSRQRAAIAAAL